MARIKGKQSFAFRASDDYGHFSNSCLFWCSLTQPHCASENEVWCAAHQIINFLARARRDCARINLFTDLGVFIIILARQGVIWERGVNMKNKFQPRWGIFMWHFTASATHQVFCCGALWVGCVITRTTRRWGVLPENPQTPARLFFSHINRLGGVGEAASFFRLLFFSAIVLKETL